MTRDLPSVVCIVGRKNAGKTELTVALAGELKRRGHRVMTAKHAHGFHLDHVGRDSWRHRHEGGALRTALASPSGFGIVGDWPEKEMHLTELVERFLWDADIVLAEGFKGTSAPKIEVFRGGGKSGPFSSANEPWSRTIVALVTDAGGQAVPIPVFELGAPGFLEALADFVEHRFIRRGRAE